MSCASHNHKSTSVPSSSLSSSMLLLLAILACHSLSVHGVFYRNIPFRYKSMEVPEQQRVMITPPQAIAATVVPPNVVMMEEEQEAKQGNRDDDTNNRQLVDQIAVQSTQLNADDDGNGLLQLQEERVGPSRRMARLISQQREMANGMETERMIAAMNGAGTAVGNPTPSSSSSASLNSHLLALRPDYAFRSVADFLRNFFDSRIERHSRKFGVRGGETMRRAHAI